MNYEQFVSHYGLKLNDSQKAAATARGNTLLLAVPGSGKTTAIIARVGYLIRCMNVDANNILTITYTTSASKDMKQRFCQTYEDIDAIPKFCTINSFCLSVIRYAKSKYSIFIPELIRDNSQIVRQLYTEKTKKFASDGVIRTLTQGITYVMNMTGCGKSEQELCKSIKIPQLSFYDIYKAYKKYKADNGLMDFDDQLLMAYSILGGFEDVLSFVKSRYPYVNVDEAQDTSYIQHKIIKLISQGNDNLFMVGDEDQSIYGFRAAYPDALLDFDKTYKNARVLLMETNYRSTGSITNAANRFIKANKHRRSKEMKTQADAGAVIKRIHCSTYSEQARFVARMLQKADKKKSVAVLFRNNDTATPFIDSFEKHGIAYTTRDSASLFFTSPTVRDVLSILEFSLDPFNGELFSRFYYKLGLYISKDMLNTALKDNATSGISLFHSLMKQTEGERKNSAIRNAAASLNRIGKCTPEEALRIVFDELNYGKWIDRSVSDGYPELPIMQRCAILRSLAQGELTVTDYLKKLERISTGELNYRRGEASVTLSTIHSSKGLEFDEVIIADAIDGIFPTADADETGLEEERRLFYVGCTRARAELEFLITDSMNGKKIKPSSFIDSFIGVIEEQKPKKKTQTRKKTLPKITSDMIGEGIMVEHKSFGAGVVTSKNGDMMSIKFISGGERKFSISTCISARMIKII